MTAPKAVGQRIRARRVKLGLTQEQAGKRSGMRRTQWLTLERITADPRLSTLRRVAEAMECTVGELVD